MTDMNGEKIRINGNSWLSIEKAFEEIGYLPVGFGVGGEEAAFVYKRKESHQMDVMLTKTNSRPTTAYHILFDGDLPLQEREKVKRALEPLKVGNQLEELGKFLSLKDKGDGEKGDNGKGEKGSSSLDEYP